MQPGDVALELLLARTLGRGADDDAGVLGRDPLEDRLEPGALGVGQLAADAGHPAVGHVDQVAAGQADLAGEPRALVADRVLGDLHEDRLAGLERLLDRGGRALEAARVVVDLAGVEHGVAALADVDERRLHARQHVLHLAEVDVAGVRRRAGLGDVVLDQDVVLEHGDLGAVAGLAHDHDPVDGLAAGEELGLGEDRRAAPALLAALAATLPLGLEAGRAGQAANLVVAAEDWPRGADADDGVRRVVRGRLGALAGSAAAAATATAGAAATVALGLVVLGVGVLSGLGGRRPRPRRSARPVGVVGAATAAAATATTTAAAGSGPVEPSSSAVLLVDVLGRQRRPRRRARPRRSRRPAARRPARRRSARRRRRAAALRSPEPAGVDRRRRAESRRPARAPGTATDRRQARPSRRRRRPAPSADSSTGGANCTAVLRRRRLRGAAGSRDLGDLGDLGDVGGGCRRPARRPRRRSAAAAAALAGLARRTRALGRRCGRLGSGAAAAGASASAASAGAVRRRRSGRRVRAPRRGAGCPRRRSQRRRVDAGRSLGGAARRPAPGAVARRRRGAVPRGGRSGRWAWCRRCGGCSSLPPVGSVSSIRTVLPSGSRARAVTRPLRSHVVVGCCRPDRRVGDRRRRSRVMRCRRRYGGRGGRVGHRLTVRRERVGDLAVVVEQPLRQPGHPSGGCRRREVGHLTKSGQDVVGSYGRVLSCRTTMSKYRTRGSSSPLIAPARRRRPTADTVDDDHGTRASSWRRPSLSTRSTGTDSSARKALDAPLRPASATPSAARSARARPRSGRAASRRGPRPPRGRRARAAATRRAPCARRPGRSRSATAISRYSASLAAPVGAAPA